MKDKFGLARRGCFWPCPRLCRHFTYNYLKIIEMIILRLEKKLNNFNRLYLIDDTAQKVADVFFLEVPKA